MQNTEESEKGTYVMGQDCYSRTRFLQGFSSSDFHDLDTLEKIQLWESYRKLH
jgi:hypothetical protein